MSINLDNSENGENKVNIKIQEIDYTILLIKSQILDLERQLIIYHTKKETLKEQIGK